MSQCPGTSECQRVVQQIERSVMVHRKASSVFCSCENSKLVLWLQSVETTQPIAINELKIDIQNKDLGASMLVEIGLVFMETYQFYHSKRKLSPEVNMCEGFVFDFEIWQKFLLGNSALEDVDNQNALLPYNSKFKHTPDCSVIYPQKHKDKQGEYWMSAFKTNDPVFKKLYFKSKKTSDYEKLILV